VKIKYSDFREFTRSKATPAPFASIGELRTKKSLSLPPQPTFPIRKEIQLFGTACSSLKPRRHPEMPQLALPL
jgi:hypothetical protein